MNKKLLVHIENEIGWITLNQPERLNAINFEMMDLLHTALHQLKEDDGVKVVVVTGAGEKAFCSGGDLAAFHQLRSETEAYAMLSKMGSILYELFTYPKPTVALLNGVAVGGGCEIASACDFRLALPHVKFGFIQGTLGITTGWGGTTFLMERIAHDVALEWLLSATKYTTTQGFEKGFIQQILDESADEEGYGKWLLQITNQSLEVLKAYKQRRLDQLDLKKVEQNIEAEIRACSRLWASEEHHRAVDAFLKRF